LPRYTALLDACVLVPITLADTLLRLAERELYRPLWSDRILGEAADAIGEIHPDLAPDLVAKRFAAMNDRFEDARVEGWEVLERTLTLPDDDDRHVVAAAMSGRADAIVTANIRDFPYEVLEPLGLAVVEPDDFLLDQQRALAGRDFIIGRHRTHVFSLRVLPRRGSVPALGGCRQQRPVGPPAAWRRSVSRRWIGSRSVTSRGKVRVRV
jgi:predicted nucleic acid-binding protein